MRLLLVGVLGVDGLAGRARRGDGGHGCGHGLDGRNQGRAAERGDDDTGTQRAPAP
ncbi:hypothetical protein [Streptomyces venezuelae]|uniref:hypothetical protein n=1 Tax=Streptomyces venezuelae TaxID=54571 RepID=UPI0036643DDF